LYTVYPSELYTIQYTVYNSKYGAYTQPWMELPTPANRMDWVQRPLAAGVGLHELAPTPGIPVGWYRWSHLLCRSVVVVPVSTGLAYVLGAAALTHRGKANSWLLSMVTLTLSTLVIPIPLHRWSC
jgi:hypothetical protein